MKDTITNALRYYASVAMLVHVVANAQQDFRSIAWFCVAAALVFACGETWKL